jgi:O-antigen/teichoic acid export membrane protein
VSSEAARRVGRSTAVNWAAWILARALALATLLLLVRTLGGDELGALLAALAAGVLGAALATGGLADATARQAAAAGDGGGFGRGDLRRAVRRFAAVLPLVLAAVIVISTGSGGGLGASGVAAAVVLAVTQGATTIGASVFRARNQPGRFALATNLAASAGRAGIAALALGVDLSGDAVLWAFALLNLIVATVTWQHATRGLADTTSEASGIGALQLGGVLWSLLGNLDVVIVGLLLGAAPAGIYSVSLRVAEFSAQFLVVISLFFLPEATRLAVAGARDAVVALYRTACRWSAFTTLLVAGIGFVTAPELAQIVFPDERETTATLLRILFAGYGVQGALGVSYATLSAVGAYGAIWRSSLAGLALLVVGTIVLTGVWELTGAAVSTLAAYALLNVWWTRCTVAALQASPFNSRYLRFAGAAMAGWLAAGLVDLGAAEADAGAVLTVAAAGVAGLAAGATLLLASGALSPGERRLAVRALRPRASGGRPDRARPPASRG